MKFVLAIGTLAVVLMALSPITFGQTGEKVGSNPNSVIVAQGTTGKLSLQTRHSSKLSEVGEEVVATLSEPVRVSDGRVAVSRGVEFTGRITQVQPARRPQHEATMTIVFETMRMPYGVEKIATLVTAIDDFANDS